MSFTVLLHFISFGFYPRVKVEKGTVLYSLGPLC